MGNSIQTTLIMLIFFFGIGLPQAHSENTITEGSLAGIGNHQAIGKVQITQNPSGSPTLILMDITVDRVPDGRVYLAQKGDHTKGVELGKLKQFSGTVSFSIPASVNLEEYDSIVIWCKKFSVGIGHAFFERR